MPIGLFRIAGQKGVALPPEFQLPYDDVVIRVYTYLHAYYPYVLHLTSTYVRARVASLAEDRDTLVHSSLYNAAQPDQCCSI